LDLKQFNDALREFRITQGLLPDFAPAYDGSGNALSLQGKLDDAIHDYRRAVQISPDFEKGRYNLQVALARKQHQSEQSQ
jgi:tetratricopeptide (TPR) repeat protein